MVTENVRACFWKVDRLKVTAYRQSWRNGESVR